MPISSRELSGAPGSLSEKQGEAVKGAKTEEIYFITHGSGRMRIEAETRDVKAGDAIAIPPGRRHKL